MKEIGTVRRYFTSKNFIEYLECLKDILKFLFYRYFIIIVLTGLIVLANTSPEGYWSKLFLVEGYKSNVPFVWTIDFQYSIVVLLGFAFVGKQLLMLSTSGTISFSYFITSLLYITFYLLRMNSPSYNLPNFEDCMTAIVIILAVSTTIRFLIWLIEVYTSNKETLVSKERQGMEKVINNCANIKK